MITKIYFIENSFNYNAHYINDSTIAGSEKTLINITNELGKNENLLIKVFNNTTKPKLINKVHWLNTSQIDKNDSPDFVVSMSDANLFYKLSGKKNYLWSHSVQNFEKFLRKKQLIPFIKFKPVMILEGNYHYKTRSIFTSFYGKKVLPIATDDDFIKTIVDIDFVPKKKAIFTTRSDRNLNFLLECWNEIKKKAPDAELHINPPYDLSDDDKKKGIILRSKGSKKDLINDLLSSRLMINPGHKGEVFCLAAEEARELCLPIVTMGHGSLYERVKHNETGYLAKNKDEFINYSIKLLNNDNIYLNLKKKLKLKRNSRSYTNVVIDLLKILHES